MIVTEKKLKGAKAHNTKSTMRNLAKTIVVVAVSAALFTLPAAKAAPHWITLIIAEIVAGKATDAALNAWIAKNGDPRPLKVSASSAGIYPRWQEYRISKTYNYDEDFPKYMRDWTGTGEDFCQSGWLNFRGDFVTTVGNRQNRLKNANLAGWEKVFKIVDPEDDAILWSSSLGQAKRIVFYGTMDKPFDKDAANRKVKERYGEEWELGKEVFSRDETWEVGKFVVYSKAAVPALAHPKVRVTGTFTVGFTYKKNRVAYYGELSPYWPATKHCKRFEMNAVQDDNKDFNLCDSNEIITELNTPVGGVERWAEKKYSMRHRWVSDPYSDLGGSWESTSYNYRLIVKQKHLHIEQDCSNLWPED